MCEFLKKAFADMKESAKAQHEVDKANFAAVKAERDKQIAEAKERQNAAQTRIDATKKNFITLVLGVMGACYFLSACA